jgi:hypothetical protein
LLKAGGVIGGRRGSAQRGIEPGEDDGADPRIVGWKNEALIACGKGLREYAWCAQDDA